MRLALRAASAAGRARCHPVEATCMQRKGFTLIELLVVIAIMTVLIF
jgi:prepilin-type N-terminal cleavage/methylation domain-containing protein